VRDLRKKVPAEGVGRSPVGFGDGSAVDREGRPGVGVAEAGLGGLDVYALHHERGRVGPTEVVEAGALEAGPGDCREPDPQPQCE
jgi:hypothetical protein